MSHNYSLTCNFIAHTLFNLCSNIPIPSVLNRAREIFENLHFISQFNTNLPFIDETVRKLSSNVAKIVVQVIDDLYHTKEVESSE